MLKAYRNSETGEITAVQTSAGIFSYAYLTTPDSSFGSPVYRTEFVTRDKKTVDLVKEYLAQVVNAAKSEQWGGKLPKGLNLPVRNGNEGNELEDGAFVLKLSNKVQPDIYIKENGKAHQISEDEIDDIYSGMEGEVIFSFKAYNMNGAKGVKAYLNGVCKTGEGKPIGTRISFVDAFSDPGAFDDDDEEGDSDVDTDDVSDIDSLLDTGSTKKNKSQKTQKETTQSTKSKPKGKTKPVVEEPDDDDDDDEDDDIGVDINSLLKG